MGFVIVSDMPGEEPGTGWKRYIEARDELYNRCPSDKAYEDIMNGLAYLDKNNQVVYYPYEEEDDYY